MYSHTLKICTITGHDCIKYETYNILHAFQMHMLYNDENTCTSILNSLARLFEVHVSSSGAIGLTLIVAFLGRYRDDCFIYDCTGLSGSRFEISMHCENV